MRGAKGVAPALPTAAALLGVVTPNPASLPRTWHPWPWHPSLAPTTAAGVEFRGFLLQFVVVPGMHPKQDTTEQQEHEAVWVGAP